MSWSVSAGGANVGALLYAGIATGQAATTGFALGAGVVNCPQITPFGGFVESNSLPLLNTTFTGALSAEQLKVVLIPTSTTTVAAAIPAVTVSTANGMLFACPATTAGNYLVLIYA